MLEHFYEAAFDIRRLRNGVAGPHIDGFADELFEVGYSRLSAHRYIRAVEHLLYWVRRRGIVPETLSKGCIQRFHRHLRYCKCHHFGKSDFQSLRSGSRLFLRFLQDRGIVEIPAQAMPVLLKAFCDWMYLRRGTTPAALYNYSLVIVDLLRTIGEDPRHLDAATLRRFVLDRSRRCGLAKAKMMVTALRAFVRFLIADGKCPVGLDEAIPGIAAWRLSALPRYLQPDEIERVVASCHPSQEAGLRDRAIVLLLARLGLRAGDILRMKMSDIDWQEAWVRVSGKGRRQTQLPLSQELGDAIIAYIRGARPQVETDILFMRSRAPVRGFANHCAVSAIVARALRRAGIAHTVRGAAHLLRHSAATAMLRHGATLREIASILRHQSIETTEIYAKVDVTALLQIAQPWPGVSLC